MNVTEIIRELKMTRDEFFPLTVELGFDIGERAIKVDDRIAVKLIEAIKKQRKLKQQKSLFHYEQQPDAKKEATTTANNIIEITDPITTRQFADLLHKPVSDVIAVLLRNGIMATINQNLDFDTATIIAEDFGYTTKLASPQNENNTHQLSQDQKLKSALESDQANHLINRPPIIVVMGHVDHGKTKLLDAIRKTDIVSQEAGGITQSIGAYTIEHNGQPITFIDTPGHEAFTAMRSRGANIADLAILVVAADDGVKPQTLEAIEILEKAKLPFVVAVNKIDKPEADIDKVKKDLSKLNLVPEDWGGKTICVPISAKAGQHIDDLLNMVLLLAELNRDHIKANPNRDAVGTIIESRVDKDSGAIATVLVQTGTLKVGDIVEVGEVVGKIRAMKSWKGTEVASAPPATPVRFLGLKSAPVVGDILTVTKDKEVLKRKKQKSYQTFSYLTQRSNQEHTKTDKIKLNMIIKADTLGSLEAVIGSLHKIQHPAIELAIIKRGLGNFTEKDIDQAVAAKAKLIGFNVDLTPAATDYALGTQTTVQSFSIIYKLIEQVERLLEELLPPEIIYTKIGELKILAVFRSMPKFTIAGGRVQQGMVKQKSIAKIVRHEKMVGEATITQLQSNKKDIGEVANGTECGLRLETTTLLQINDILEIYQTEERKRQLH